MAVIQINCFSFPALLLPLWSIALWLHFMMAFTARATLGNSTNPEEDRSDFSGNIRTCDGRQSLLVNAFSSWSSDIPGGVLKKCRICDGSIGAINEERCRIIILCKCIPCLVAGCDFCWLGSTTENDCSWRRCSPWSWSNCPAGCRGWWTLTSSSAWKICNPTNEKDCNQYHDCQKKKWLWQNLRNLNFATIISDWNVVQVLDAAFHCDSVSHLDHGGSLFGLQELYLDAGRKKIAILIQLSNKETANQGESGEKEIERNQPETMEQVGK